MSTTYKFTITEDMVKYPLAYWKGKGTEYARLREAIGLVQTGDIGKRVYEVKGENGYTFFQVENNEQRDRRIGQ